MMLRGPLAFIATLYILVTTYLLVYVLSPLNNMEVFINVY